MDLPGGALFALLRSDDNVDAASGYALSAFAPVIPENIRKGDDWRARYRFLKSLRGSAPVPRWLAKPYSGAKYNPSGYPMLVRFGDIRDARSVMIVNPDHLAASYGPGVNLKRITAEITDDPVTKGIRNRLKWLGTTVTGYLDGQATSSGSTLSNVLDTTAFISVAH